MIEFSRTSWNRPTLGRRKLFGYIDFPYVYKNKMENNAADTPNIVYNNNVCLHYRYVRFNQALL